MESVLKMNGHRDASTLFGLRNGTTSIAAEFSAVPPDEPFIRNVSSLEGADRLVAHHEKQRFLAVYASLREQLTRREEVLEPRIEELGAEKKETTKKIDDIPQYIKEQTQEQNEPWTTSERVTVIFLAVCSLLLLLIGVNTLATYLIGSGYIVFIEKPYLAYLLSTVNIGIAGLLKIGEALKKENAAKEKYIQRLWYVGMFFGAVWLITFSILFPNIGTESIDRMIEGIAEGDQSYNKLLENVFVCSQLIAEICIAAVMWIHLQRLCVAHGPSVRIKENPEYTVLSRDLKRCIEEYESMQEENGFVKGKLKTLDALEHTLLSQAAGLLAAERIKSLETHYNIQ